MLSNKLHHPHLGEIRPRFKLMTSLTPDEALETLKQELQSNNSVKGYVVNDLANIGIADKDSHYWSPELQVRFEPLENGIGSEIRCLVGPRQSVWVMFVFFYITVSLSTFFGGMYGLIQWSMDHYSSFIWCIPAGIIILPSIYLFARLGQKKGHDQMDQLLDFLYFTLKEKGAVEPIS